MARRRTRSRGRFGGASMLKQVAFGAAVGYAVQTFSPVKGILPAAGVGYVVGKLPGAVGGAAVAAYLGGTGTNNMTVW